MARLDGHADYVRSAAAAPGAAGGTTWATGGYDHMCRLWDVRQRCAVAALDHGDAITAVAFLPSGGALVTAGGSYVCVWDLLSGGRLLRRLANHQKTVTCLAVSDAAGPASAASARLLSGSLDGHVKVYELDTYRVTHASRYAAPVTALAISPDASSLAVGMSDGTLSVRRHATATRAAAERHAAHGRGEVNPFDTVQRRAPRLTAANYRYFLRGQSAKAAEGDVKIAARRKVALAPYDAMLRKFRCAGLCADVPLRHATVLHAASAAAAVPARCFHLSPIPTPAPKPLAGGVDDLAAQHLNDSCSKQRRRSSTVFLHEIYVP